MAQVIADSSIYSKMKVPDFVGDISKGFEDGMTMRSMIDKRKEEQGIKDVYQKNIVKNPDGSISFNPQTASELVGFSPQEAFKFNQQQKEQQLSDIKIKTERANQLTDYLGRAYQQMKKTNGQGYQELLADAKTRGYDISMMPPVWGPEADQKLGYHYGQALTISQQMDQAEKDRRFNLDKQKADLEEKKLLAELKKKATSGEDLPLDKKKIIEGLSTKNANKIAIKNQIQAVVDSWDNLSDEQKVTQGSQLLKTLNSSEGADAIGVEEAKRLGSMLEFQMFNVTKPGAFIGRDYQGFKEQATNTAKNIGTAINANQSVIDQAMGRQVKPLSNQPQTVIQNGFTYTFNPVTGKYE